MPLNNLTNITCNDATGAARTQVALLDDGTCRVMKPLPKRARIAEAGKENSSLKVIKISNKTYHVMPHSDRPLCFLRYPMDTSPLRTWLAGPNFPPELEYTQCCDEAGALFEIRLVWDMNDGSSVYKMREVTLDVAALSPTEDPDEDEPVVRGVHRVLDWIASFKTTSATASNVTSTAATAPTASPSSMCPLWLTPSKFSFMPIRDDVHTQHRAMYRPWPRLNPAHVSGSIADAESA